MQTSRVVSVIRRLAFSSLVLTLSAGAAPVVTSVQPIGERHSSGNKDRFTSLNNNGRLAGSAVVLDKITWIFEGNGEGGFFVEGPQVSLRPAYWEGSNGSQVDFDLPGGDRATSGGIITSINDSGVFTGSMSIAVSNPSNFRDDPQSAALIYSSGLPSAPLVEIPFAQSTRNADDLLGEVTAINNTGLMVGVYTFRAGPGGELLTHPFRYQANAAQAEDLHQMIELRYGTLDQVRLIDVNDAGQIIGNVSVPGVGFRSFVINGTQISDLANLDDVGADVVVYAINSNGAIVGETGKNGIYTGFLYDGGVMTRIVTPESIGGVTPVDINDQGVIVGYCRATDSNGFSPQKAFIISDDFHLLESLVPAALQATFEPIIHPTKINNNGLILAMSGISDFFTVQIATGRTAIWDGKEGFEFDRAENWSINDVPGTADTVQLSEPGTKTIEFPANQLFQNSRLVANSGSQTDIDLNGSVWRFDASGETGILGTVSFTGASVEITDGTVEASSGVVILRNDGISASYLGLAGAGKLRVPDGSITVGRAPGSTVSTLSVEGANSLAEASALNVGESGRGRVLVLAGGTVDIDSNFYIGVDAEGEMTLGGSGSTVRVGENGDVRVGFHQPGMLTLENGASANFGEGTALRIGGEEIDGQFSLSGENTLALMGGPVFVARSGIFTQLDGAQMIAQRLEIEGGSLFVGAGPSLAIAGLAADEDISLFDGASAEVGAGGVLSGSDLLVSSSQLNPSQLTIASGGTVIVNGTGHARLLGGLIDVAQGGVLRAVDLTITRGRLFGRGTIEGSVINNGGTVEPGESPGILTIEGDYTQTAGNLILEVGGVTPGTQHDRFVVSGNISVAGGGITLAFINGFAPANGQEFDFLEVGGDFDTTAPITVTGLLPGWQFGTDFNPVSGKFTVTSLSQGSAAPAAELVFQATAIIPATAGNPAVFSGKITGPAGMTVVVEVSVDLGASDEWQGIQSLTLDSGGNGTITNLTDPGSIASPRNFLRLRQGF